MENHTSLQEHFLKEARRQRMPLTVSPTLEDYLQCDAESRRMAASILGIS